MPETPSRLRAFRDAARALWRAYDQGDKVDQEEADEALYQALEPFRARIPDDEEDDAIGPYFDIVEKVEHGQYDTQNAAVNALLNVVEKIAGKYGDPDAAEVASIDPALVALVADEYGVSGVDGVRMAERLVDRIGHEQVQRLARRVVHDQQTVRDADLDQVVALNAVELLARPHPDRPQLLGHLVHEGHNCTITARWKVGKSTVAENITMSLLTGEPFLGRYETPQRRVALLNYELDEIDMDLRLRRLGLDDETLERLLVVNLRGHRLPLMTGVGRDWLTERLDGHKAEVLIVDPFGAAYAVAGGQSENDNAEVRRFLSALDEIKRLSGVGSLFMPVHTGRAEQFEGEERARGATVLDDWCDVRMVLTKDKDDRRFLRTEGRAWDMPESLLSFDETTGRLSLGIDALGVSRAASRRLAHAQVVVDIVEAEPGINTRELRDALAEAGVTNNTDKDNAITAARADRIHTHRGKRNALLHYPGLSSECVDCMEKTP